MKMKMSTYLREFKETGMLPQGAAPAMHAFYAGSLTADALTAASGNVKSPRFQEKMEQLITVVEYIERAAEFVP